MGRAALLWQLKTASTMLSCPDTRRHNSPYFPNTYVWRPPRRTRSFINRTSRTREGKGPHSTQLLVLVVPFAHQLGKTAVLAKGVGVLAKIPHDLTQPLLHRRRG